MKNEFLFLLLAGIIAIITALILNANVGDRYYDGQIDALNGTAHYELVTQENNTVRWESTEPYSIECTTTFINKGDTK